jgi:hypothetical protein
MVLPEENLSPRNARDGARAIEGFDLVFREAAEQIAIAGGRSRYLSGGLDGLAPLALREKVIGPSPFVL